MTESETNDIQSETNPSSNRPIAKFNGTGGLQLAVWKQRNDAGRDHYSIMLERSYKSAEGEFKSTQYLREGDLLRAAKLIEEADRWIEQDRTKARGTNSAQTEDRSR